MMNKVFSSDFAFRKVDQDLRLVTGWASVVVDKGETVVDLQGDMIEPDELRKAVHDFMGSRETATMHSRDGNGDPIVTGEIVDSLVVTKDVAEALGMSPDRLGWVASIRVLDDATWARVKSGELRAFSFGGRAERVEDE